MKILNYVTAVIFLLSAVGCSQETPAEKMSISSSSPQTDIAALERLISLPVQPVTVKWSLGKVVAGQSTAIGPDDWGVVALISLNEEDLNVLSQTPSPATATGLPAYLIQPWLTDIVQAKFKPDSTGQFYIPQTASLKAEQFYKSPLLSGAAFAISNNEILVYLQTR